MVYQTKHTLWERLTIIIHFNSLKPLGSNVSPEQVVPPAGLTKSRVATEGLVNVDKETKCVEVGYDE
jgi:hypothetical protein